MVTNTKKKNKDIRILIICHVIGFLVIGAFGSISNDIAKAYPNAVTRILLPCNYSLWEQGKIVVTPILLIFIIEYFVVGKNFPNFISAHFMIGFLLPMLTYGIYHVHGFIFGNSLSLEGAHVVLSIAIILCGFLASVFLVTAEKDYTKLTKIFMPLYIIMLIAYVVFSFMPPKAVTFFDPINEVFGTIYK